MTEKKWSDEIEMRINGVLATDQQCDELMRFMLGIGEYSDVKEANHE